MPTSITTEQTHALLDLYDSLCARPDLQLDMWLEPATCSSFLITQLHTQELTTRIGLSLSESAIFCGCGCRCNVPRLFYSLSLER